MTDIAVDNTQELRDYAGYMRGGAVADFGKIKKYVHDEGCSKKGFTGLFSLLSGSMDVLSGIFDQVAQFGEDRLRAGADGLDATAKAYDDIEQHHKKNLLDLKGSF
ncbi:hypothetical protein FPZ12_030515 [Amycolatopsis acidicola]|uniref:ESX-1 secretion-associated protein n=1 Tax=Amycolatopsis acidicola TaxID=2596893 RepID=A0A5N0UZ06_9PSEU|nr:hypothetical protein [Amycolatopsis acidicola]KAA9155176.1 hypothetical protein FPZ12_030515 [Amycolatopsis acidicola]